MSTTLDVDLVITGIRCNTASSKTALLGVGDDTDETYILVTGSLGDGAQYSKRFPGNDNYYSCKTGTFYDEGRKQFFIGVDGNRVPAPNIGHWKLKDNEKIALVFTFAEQQNMELQGVLKFLGEAGESIIKALQGAKDNRSNLEKAASKAAGEMLKSVDQGDYPLGSYSLILENQGGKLISYPKGEHYVALSPADPWGSELQKQTGARLQTFKLKGKHNNCDYDIWIWWHAKAV